MLRILAIAATALSVLAFTSAAALPIEPCLAANQVERGTWTLAACSSGSCSTGTCSERVYSAAEGDYHYCDCAAPTGPPWQREECFAMVLEYPDGELAPFCTGYIWVNCPGTDHCYPEPTVTWAKCECRSGGSW